MKRNILVLLIIFSFFTVIKAQNSGEGVKFSIAGGVELPSGDFGDVASMGYGGSLFIDIPLLGNPFLPGAGDISLRAGGGYTDFGSVDEGMAPYSYTYEHSNITARLGLGVPIIPGLSFYLDMIINFLKWSNQAEGMTFEGNETILGGGVGAELDLFRIEGHVGKAYAEVHSEFKNLKNEYNLPLKIIKLGIKINITKE